VYICTIFIPSIQNKNQKAFTKAEITNEKAHTKWRNGELNKGRAKEHIEETDRRSAKGEKVGLCVWRYVLPN
jgi:hypothetical protein